MIGAIIGDIVGSRFEFNNYRSKDFELFSEDCKVTDDSIMTLAIAKAIMETEKVIQPTLNDEFYHFDYYSLVKRNVIKFMQQIGRKYPNCGYGGMFANWVFSENPQAYNSFGNGAAMRISPVGFFAKTESEVCKLSEAVTAVTHNHKEGLKGAEATAIAIFMAQKGFTKEEIREKIERDYYSLNFTIDEIRDTYKFNETCQETVPQAIQAFLESTSFEDAIRTAISVGGDSDTLAAITGSIAEAYYGVPESLKEKALSYLDDELISIYNDWSEFFGEYAKTEKFHLLTKYIGKLSGEKTYDEWNDEDIEIYDMQSVNYNELTSFFVTEFYQFVESHPEYELKDYVSILEKNGLKWDSKSMKGANVDILNEQCILALITGAIRADRFSEGILFEFLEEGYILKWLKRLKDMDFNPKKLEEIYFNIGGFSTGYDKYHITFDENTAYFINTSLDKAPIEKTYSFEERTSLIESFQKLHVEYWNNKYVNRNILDGTQWTLAVKWKNSRGEVWSGSNAFPPNWEELLSFFGIDE